MIRRPGPDHFALLFSGNAFEAPPRIAHQRPRPSRLRRTLRALVLWLLQPPPSRDAAPGSRAPMSEERTMLTDTRIIQQHGPYAVQAQRLDIHWPDTSTVGMHPVRLRGRDERYLRALQYDRLLWLVVDVRDLAPSLASEIPALPWADTDGLVLHTLRLSYPNADALRVRAVTRIKTGWAAMPGVAPSFQPRCATRRHSSAGAMGVPA